MHPRAQTLPTQHWHYQHLPALPRGHTVNAEASEEGVVAWGELRWLTGPIGRRVIPQRAWDELMRFSRKTSEPVPQMIVAGPGVLWAYMGNLIIWTFFVGFTYLASQVCYCSEPEGDVAGPRPGEGRYPTIVLGLFALVLIPILYCELMSLGYVLIPMVQVTKRFKFLCLNFSRLPFGVWLTAMIGLSIFSHMDLATNALFVATTKVSFSDCNRGADMSAVWEDTIEQAHLSWVPGAGNFEYMINACWVMMFMQSLFALCDVVPLFPCLVSYDCGEGDKTYTYRTLAHASQNHGAALASLHTVGRMATGTFQAEAYSLKKFEQRYEELMQLLRDRQEYYGGIVPTHSLNDDQGTQARQLFDFCQSHSRGKIFRGIMTFGLVGVLECGVFLHAQITYAALVCAVTGEPIVQHGQMLVSIVLSILMAFKRAYDAVMAFVISCNNVRDLHRAAAACKKQHYDDMNNWSQFRLRIFLMVYLSYFALLVWAVFKIMALVECPHGLWNITSGCVVDGHVAKYPSSRGTDRQVQIVYIFGTFSNAVLLLVFLRGVVKYCGSC